ncbi:hypothetical protein [Pedobacter psychrodurus]|uniref:hypothetical protein n=1 Tax=Pedobacter psychrodurus TaxID=2530456 RepID=UPI00292EB3D3|nr:hypothetical protein [Pedobacter psychrodurus]
MKKSQYIIGQDENYGKQLGKIDDKQTAKYKGAHPDPQYIRIHKIISPQTSEYDDCQTPEQVSHNRLNLRRGMLEDSFYRLPYIPVNE